MIKAVVHIGFPRDRVYRVLIDFAAYQEWLPGCKRSVVLSSEGNRTDLETTVHGLNPIELRFEADPGQSLRFRMTKGNELKRYSGEHRLMDAADGKGTVIVTEVEVDAGALVPRFMLDPVVRKVLAAMSRGLAERVQATSAMVATATAQRPETRKRRRRILQIASTPGGQRIWYLGKIYRPKD